MAENQTVADGKVVLIRYTLTDTDGKVLDTTGEGVFAYLHGRGNVVPGLEESLAGRAAGESLSVIVPPAKAYGDKVPTEPQPVPRKEFRKDARIEPGVGFRATGSDGKDLTLYVTKVQGSKVWVDRNHPLAGKTLAFDVEIVAIREPTHEESQHGHAHGPSGHAGH